MPLSQTDFRPGKRPRYVPSGSPRRKFPLIRIVLLLGLGFFIYTRFDSLWAKLRSVADPVALWAQFTDDEEGASGADPRLAWSEDSSRVTLKCARGLTRDCCESWNRADGDLCGTTEALLEKARWKGVLARGRDTDHPLQLEARAVVSDLGDWGFELSGLQGRDASGAFVLRRRPGSHAWCDARRGCLKALTARAPLMDGRLIAEPGTDPVRAGTTIVRWASSSSRVRAMLPGRITAVDKPAGGDGAFVSVKVYHGGELYATYGPLAPAKGVQPGVLVKSGSYLGDARPSSAGEARAAAAWDAAPPGEATGLNDGAAGYTLTVGLRQGGQPVDAAGFWGLSRHVDPDFAGPPLSALTAPGEPDGFPAEAP